MPNDKKLVPASPGPDYALRQSDAEGMKSALKGATTSRSAGMAHATAAKAMSNKKKSKSHPCLDC